MYKYLDVQGKLQGNWKQNVSKSGQTSINVVTFSVICYFLQAHYIFCHEALLVYAENFYTSTWKYLPVHKNPINNTNQHETGLGRARTIKHFSN